MIGALLLVAVVNDGLAARSVITVLFGYSRTLGRLTLFNHGAIAITDIISMAFTDRHASPNRTNVNAKHRQLVQGRTRYHSGDHQKFFIQTSFSLLRQRAITSVTKGSDKSDAPVSAGKRTAYSRDYAVSRLRRGTNLTGRD